MLIIEANSEGWPPFHPVLDWSHFWSDGRVNGDVWKHRPWHHLWTTCKICIHKRLLCWFFFLSAFQELSELKRRPRSFVHRNGGLSTWERFRAGRSGGTSGSKSPVQLDVTSNFPPRNACEQSPISYLSAPGPDSHSLLQFFSERGSKFRMEELAAGERPLKLRRCY